MKRTALLLSILIFLQSCQVYKSVDVSEVKENRTYRIHLESGQHVQGECEGIEGEQIAIRVNGNIVEFPKTNINRVEQHKVSVVKVVGAAILITAGVFLMVDIAKKDKSSINNP